MIFAGFASLESKYDTDVANLRPATSYRTSTSTDGINSNTQIQFIFLELRNCREIFTGDRPSRFPVVRTIFGIWQIHLQRCSDGANLYGRQDGARPFDGLEKLPKMDVGTHTDAAEAMPPAPCACPRRTLHIIACTTYVRIYRARLLTIFGRSLKHKSETLAHNLITYVVDNIHNWIMFSFSRKKNKIKQLQCTWCFSISVEVNVQ